MEVNRQGLGAPTVNALLSSFLLQRLGSDTLDGDGEHLASATGSANAAGPSSTLGDGRTGSSCRSAAAAAAAGVQDTEKAAGEDSNNEYGDEQGRPAAGRSGAAMLRRSQSLRPSTVVLFRRLDRLMRGNKVGEHG